MWYLLSQIRARRTFNLRPTQSSTTWRSSYTDILILRDKDANTAWSAASDGTLEERIYYCHNWRGDVSVLITDTGEMPEAVNAGIVIFLLTPAADRL